MVENDELAILKKKKLIAKAALYGVKAVPMVFINHKKAFTGAPPSIEALRQAVKG